MKKAEVIRYLEEKDSEGYLTHPLMLQIYEDDEDIPDYIIDMICYKHISPEPFIIYCGEIGMDAINEAVEAYLNSMATDEVKSEIDFHILKQ